MSRRGWFERLLAVQLRRPWSLLAVVLASVAIAIAIAARLVLLTGFESLLPESRPSVVELKRVGERTAGVSTLFVVLEGSDREGLRKAGDALVPALEKLGPPWAAAVEDNVKDTLAFLEPRAGLYADVKDLRALSDDIDARYAWEVSKAAGTDIDTGEEPPKLDADTIKKRFHTTDLGEDRFPDGYYQSKDGKTLVVALRSAVLPSDLGKGREVLKRVRDVVNEVDPSRFDPTVKWGITGDLAIGVGEYAAINRDLTDVGITGAALILGVVLLFYMRLRTALAMVLTIAVGLSWTFAITELTLGHLNIATGFLFTIVGGNGINFAILYMARYLEERRSQRDLETAIRVAHLKTWRPTLTAACAAAGSYGSLLITQFKGFREFGIIGGAGMIVCWLGTYVTLPAILVVMERFAPIDSGTKDAKGFFGAVRRFAREGVPFGRPFAWIVSRAPRTIAVAGVALAIVLGVVAARYARTNPMEYDLNQVQSDQRAVAEEQRLIKIAKAITGYIGLDGMAILVDRTDQVAPLEAELRARRDAAAPDLKPFKDVHALQDFVPKDQPEKIAILEHIKEKILRARKRHLIPDDQWRKIEPYLPPDDLAPFDMQQLPVGLARQFTERDGTRGRIVYISPTADELTNDAHYLFRWADSFRRTELPDGSVIFGSGRAVIYADMWAAILEDVPKAVVVSFGATLLVVFVAFAFRRDALHVVVSLLLGVAWMTGSLALVHARLNFLNFMALPITFGIGVDYAVNIAHRNLQTRDPILVVRRTGGAVILCSLTTLLGYLALVRSVNFAVRSLGVAAVLGEVTCLLAAVLVLPAGLVWAGMGTKTTGEHRSSLSQEPEPNEERS